MEVMRRLQTQARVSETKPIHFTPDASMTEPPEEQGGSDGKGERSGSLVRLEVTVHNAVVVPTGSHTFHVLHDHAQVAPGLEGAEHADHEGVLGEALPGVAVPHKVDGAAGGESEDRPSPPRHPASATLPPPEPRVAH
ncbi:hypothetical protein MC885_020000, partial [Smutsia gigantea]